MLSNRFNFQFCVKVVKKFSLNFAKMSLLRSFLSRGIPKYATPFKAVLPSKKISTSSRFQAALVTQKAPSFKGTAVVNGQFQQITSDDYSGKYMVLFFYPLDFTFVCPTEIISFSDRADEFKAIDAEVIGASVDSHFSHLAWINTPRKQGGLGEMKIPLLSDLTKKISSDYGVLLENAGIALRGLFIIDGNGTVRYAGINDLPVGRNVDEVLRLVKAFQFTDKHGEVCPASWTPGSKTMKPNVDGSKEYFESEN